MKYVLDIPDATVERIYRTMGDQEGFALRSFILIAIENQLELQKEDVGRRVEVATAGEGARSPVRKEVSGGTWGLVARPASEPPTVEPVPSNRRADTIDSRGNWWLWGQVNRVFPLKFVARVMARLTEEDPAPFEEASEAIGDAGRSYGLHLKKLDEEADRRRDEKLSVGFPAGDSPESAISRFRQQFFGKIRSDELISGASFALGFVGLADDGRVALTEAGRDFAALENPIFDERTHSSKALSDEEGEFYLQHLLDSADGERSAFALLLKGIKEGAATNEQLNTFMAERVGEEWSSSMVSTQRSGTMGRMLDVGVVSRRRSGRRVEFELTQRGRRFLSEAGDASGD